MLTRMWRHISLSPKNLRITAISFPPGVPGPFGRGLASLLLEEYPEYVFVLANSLLAGTKLPLLTHACMGARLPIASEEEKDAARAGMKLSNTGGLIGFRMASMGIGSISLEGHKEGSPLVAALMPGGCRFHEADGLEGLAPAAAVNRLHERFGKNCSVLLAGPAARFGYATAQLVISDHPGQEPRLSGRGGPAAAFARCGLLALVVGQKKGRAPWRNAPGAGRRVSAFVDAVVETLEAGPPPTDRLAGNRDTAAGIFIPCFTRRMECKKHCPVGRLTGHSPSAPVGADPHGDIPRFPGTQQEAETFSGACDRLGVDIHDTLRTLDMALTSGASASPGEFLRHLESGTSLGHRLGNGSRRFASSFGSAIPQKGRQAATPEASIARRGQKELLAALDCLGLCVAAACVLEEGEGLDALVGLLNVTAPGGKWDMQRIRQLGLDSLARESGPRD